MNAIIYCRVSTKEQAEQGYSLDAQENECRKFAFNKGYVVDHVFVERGESAKTQNRTELQKIIKYTIENRGKIDALIIWKLNRLARNLSDQMQLIENFSTLKIRVLSVTETNEMNSSGNLMRNMIGSFSQFENEQRAEMTVNGMKQALKQGRWCWRANIGYKKEPDNTGKLILVPSADASFITKAFTLTETGLYKQADIVKELLKDGFKKINEKKLNVILRNPIYAGMMRNRWFPELLDGIHTPLISKATFSKVQLILDGKRLRITSYKRNHPDFPLRNFVRDPKCDRKMTAGWSTGRKKKRYGHYHCYTKGCRLNVKKHELEHRFQEHLESYHPNQDGFDLFEAILHNVWKDKQSKQFKDQNQIEKNIKDLTAKKELLYEFLMKGTIDDETYKRKIKEISEEISTKQIEIGEKRIGMNNDFDGCLKYCRFFMTNVASNWATGDIDLKQRFQTLLFPDKIYYDNGTFRTTATPLLFKLLQTKHPDLSSLVAPTGFEPVFSA